MITLHFSLYKGLWIKADCNDRNLLLDIQEFLTDYKKGFKFMPKYKAGVWDGKISLFDKATRSFPYGLFVDVMKHIKKEWSDAKITIEQPIYDLWGAGNKPEYTYDLAFQPYPFQQETIEALVKCTKGIAVVATAGGKSLIISYMIRNFPKDKNKTLIIVPTLQLVDQFKGDMMEYGFDESEIGCVNSKLKEFDRPVVVSTWQSLKNQMDKAELFDAVIVDEVHTAQAATISEILKTAVNATYRFGVTGTMPTNRLDAMTVKSFLGHVSKTFTGKDLADLGYVSKCTIKQLTLKYNTGYGKDYNIIRDEVFLNPFRLSVLTGLARKTQNSMLILVDRIEKEGLILEAHLKEQLPNKTVIFLSGKDKANVRDDWRKDMNDRQDVICIATYPIFQQGVNIPSLREIVLASSTKSFVRVIQSLGRTLRKHVSKELGGAVLWDIVDDVKHLKDHGKARFKHYIKEKHQVEEHLLREPKNFF
jgi:superfamily II DNA or RNA helicase